MNYENIIVENRGPVGLITLHRPDALNALCLPLMKEVNHALDIFEADDDTGAIIITGSDKAFAAGADIKEMQDKTFSDAYLENFIDVGWGRIAKCRKPVIAAVAGYALGGGCETAMMCDFIIAADNAKFGQPEVGIGTMPGAGGTQRLTRLIGKSKAMDMCLTGRMMGVEEAERAGLVSRIFPVADMLNETIKIAEKICSFSRPIVMLNKEAVNTALETPLSEGLKLERLLCYSTFAVEDSKEGMSAFAEKRKANYKNR